MYNTGDAFNKDIELHIVELSYGKNKINVNNHLTNI